VAHTSTVFSYPRHAPHLTSPPGTIISPLPSRNQRKERKEYLSELNMNHQL